MYDSRHSLVVSLNKKADFNIKLELKIAASHFKYSEIIFDYQEILKSVCGMNSSFIKRLIKPKSIPGAGFNLNQFTELFRAKFICQSPFWRGWGQPMSTQHSGLI